MSSSPCCRGDVKRKYVWRLRICTSRIFAPESLSLALSEYNPIVGYNNCGKSNVLRAIRWFIRKSVLVEHDFKDIELPVIVSGTIVGVEGMLAVMPANQAEVLRRDIQHDSLRFRRSQPTPSCRASDIRLEVEKADGTWGPIPTGFDNTVSRLLGEPIYIEAMQNAQDDVAKFGAKNTIGLLVKYAFDQMIANNVAAHESISEALENLGRQFSGDLRFDELGELEARASDALGDFFPGIRAHINMARPSLEELMKGATLDLAHVGEAARPFSSYGHGAQRAVQIALVTMLAALRHGHGEAAGNVMLLIDEPELYLHPQAIEKLRASLKSLASPRFQVVFSTHSPLLVNKADVLQTFMFRKTDLGETVVRQKLSTVEKSVLRQKTSSLATSMLTHQMRNG